MYSPPRAEDTMAETPEEDAVLQAPLLETQADPRSEAEPLNQPQTGIPINASQAAGHQSMSTVPIMVRASAVPHGQMAMSDSHIQWGPGTEVVLANVQLPEHLPDAMARWERLSPLLMGWLVSSIASLAISCVFGTLLLYGIFGLAAGVVGIVGASLHLCRCLANIAIAAKNVRILGWVAFGLDLLAMCVALVFNILFLGSGLVHITSGLSCVLMAAHASISLWVVRSVQPVLRMLNPVSSGLVTVA